MPCKITERKSREKIFLSFMLEADPEQLTFHDFASVMTEKVTMNRIPTCCEVGDLGEPDAVLSHLES